jgi:hypothetical protein
MKKSLFLHFCIAVFTVLALAGCENLPDSLKLTVVNIAAIQGLTVPVAGETPVTEITENAQYSGTVIWKDNPSVFTDSTVYIATIVLTAKEGYTLQGVEADFFKVEGAVSVSNNANSGVVTAVFQTDTDLLPSTPITSAEIIITAPVNGAVPDTAANGAGNFTIGAVSWSPKDSPFLGNTVYTATVTLTANSRCTFNELNKATINGQIAVVSNNTDKAITLSYTFPETYDKTVTSIVIKTQPITLTYTHDDPLDLIGLVVTLTYDDNTKEDVATSSFASKNITASPSQGNSLVRSKNNNRPVVITYGDLTPLATGNLIVDPKIIDFIVDPIPEQTYTGNQILPIVMVKDDTIKLTKTTDYTVTYANNTNPGTASVTITGMGNYEGSSGRAEFTINPETITDVDIVVIAPVPGAAPTTPIGADKFTVAAVSWSPAHNPFQNGIVYTVELLLTANNGYTFTGIKSATVNDKNAMIISNNGAVVRLSFAFPKTEIGLPNIETFNGSRYEADSYIDDDRIKYSYTYDGWDFYYIYLGQLKNIPLFYDEPHLHDHTYTSTKYRFETTQTTTEEISNTVSKTSGEAVTVTEEHTESNSTGGKTSWEISAEFKVIPQIKVGVKHTAEDSWEKLVSDTSRTEIQRTTSLTNTVEYVTSNANSVRRSREFELTRADREGWYRYTRFSISDVYLYVIMNSDRDTKELYYEFKECIIPDGSFWALDYSPTFPFNNNKNDDTKFKLDIEILRKLPPPPIDIDNIFDIYNVKTTDEWKAALSDIQSKGNGTAGKPKTYTIIVHGDVTVPPTHGSFPIPASFSSVQHIEVTLKGDGEKRKLNLGAKGNILYIGSNQKLIIDDENLTLQGRTDNTTSLLFIAPGGNLELKNGNIIGNISKDSLGSTNGGGVFINESGVFTMSGGTISGNSGSLGGGVYVCGGTFTMSDGTISDNLVGGGVNVGGGTFTMKDGTIEGNKLTNGYNGGGGVSVVEGGEFIMKGGVIRRNEATAINTSNAWAGGVLIHGKSSTFKKTGGIIYGNNGLPTQNIVTVVGSTVGKMYAHAVLYHFGDRRSRNKDLMERDNISTDNPDGWGQ